jgi:hypothetical protein
MKTIYKTKQCEFSPSKSIEQKINDYNLQDNQSNIFLLEEKNNFYWYFVAKLPDKCGIVREKLADVKNLSSNQNNLIAELIKNNGLVEFKFTESSAIKRSRSGNVYQPQQNNSDNFLKLHFKMRDLLKECQEEGAVDEFESLVMKHFSSFQLKTIKNDFLINQLKQVAIIFYAKKLINEDDLNKYFDFGLIENWQNNSVFQNLLPNSCYNLQEKLSKKEQNICINKNEENIMPKLITIYKPKAINVVANKPCANKENSK